jgi:lipopolysaccharide/colanic/teichoic acid biosynthesis glycosyltransferase
VTPPAAPLELETPLTGLQPVERVGREARKPAARRPRGAWGLRDEEWDELEPAGVYARTLRAPLLVLAALAMLPCALLLALPIALVNLALHGPRRILFAQLRVGRRGRLFVLYKFRTLRDVPGADHARATPFGRFLRNTHLDELPQLLNVLRGDMCLIGPRPEMVATERWAALHCPAFRERLVLLPGLTGYAQITQGYTHGGDAHAYDRKHELNRHYRERLGFALDCAILARTVVWMLRGRGWRSARGERRRT